MTIGMTTANEEFMRKIIFLSLITLLAVGFFIVGSIVDLFRGKKTPPVEKTKILAVRRFDM